MHLIHAVVFSSDLWDVKQWNEEEKQEAGEKKFLTRPVQCFAAPIHSVRELMIFISGEAFYWKVSSLYLANRSVQYIVLVRGRCYAGKAGIPMKLAHVGLIGPSTSDPLPWGCLFTDLPVFSILLSFFPSGHRPNPPLPSHPSAGLSSLSLYGFSPTQLF